MGNIRLKDLVRQFPVVTYYLVTFLISWSGALILIAPKLLAGEPVPKFTGLMMFPVMLLGPLAGGIGLTIITEGREGLKKLGYRLFRWRVPLRWYAFALIPPVLILGTLFILRILVSPVFTANFFPVGILFALPAGIVEEVGWTGFAIYRLSSKYKTLTTGIIVGIFWGLWHFPVIDFLGFATPHGKFLLPFFFSFILLLSAMRIIMVWVYRFTGSILIVQLMHVFFTGSLTMLGPANVTAGQETLWYASFSFFLWLTVVIVHMALRKTVKPGSLKIGQGIL
jgi:CAAX protease family protein